MAETGQNGERSGVEQNSAGRRAESDGQGGSAAGHKALQKTTSWRDHMSLSNPKLWVFIAAVVVISLVGYVCGKQLFAALITAKEWFRASAPWSVLFYYVLLIGWSVVLMPYGPLCIAVGFIFGFYWGLVIQVGAMVCTNIALYIVGRYLLRDWVERQMNQHRIWKGLTHMLATDWQEAAKINLLLCFMPIPYGSHGYLFALSDVPFSQFLPVFIFGMLPNTCINLLIGEAMSEASDPHGTSTYNTIGIALVITALVVAVCHASTVAHKVLDQAEAPSPRTGPQLSENQPLVSAANNV
uniref:VTT domain-containing protein n=1 Tax=Hemiselmis andersenii TaxID=464988 RepID=A0A7S1MZ39_HEMAN|mmetsp:Transcript_9673/g.23639  ORF Transcript_9673/g.23639 Transcript_9673/m.23639 type:complete len:298 (+) Transcript_9673:127-1020(+)